MLETGKILQNRYLIDKPIGQGGMGAVYVATDQRFGSVVAIKETFFSDENYGKAFEREARLLNNLRHSALPRVSDHFAEENGQFLVMEYIDGDDLSEKMQENGTAFPIKDVINWADQLLDALDFLHTQETPVIHRDIKPQNLKVTARGQIILLDFGLAKGNPTDASHKTAAHSVFGYSKNYASLEQMQGTGTDPRSDLYSLGATLYHLMTGTAPADALTRAMTVLNGEEDPLKPANLVHEQVPVSVAQVLMRAMALNANHRPSSAMAMRTMLAESAESIIDDLGTNVNSQKLPNLLTQKTELIETAQESKNTEQTALLTSNTPEAIIGADSVKKLKEQRIETRPNSASANILGQKKQPKNGLLIGAVIGGLLMAGSAAGLYIINPDIFNPSFQNSEANPEAGNSSMQTSAVSSANANSNIVPANSNIASTTNAEAAVIKKENTDKTASKVATADKNTSKTTKPQIVTPPKPPEKPDVEMGENDVKVKGDRIETRDIVVDKGRVIFKNPNQRPRIQDGRPPLTMEQIRNLPPAQRRRVLRVIQRNKQQDIDNDSPDN